MPSNSRRALLVPVSHGLVAGLTSVLTVVLAGCVDRPALVLAGGRVIDPESGLDGIRWIAIDGGRVVEISERALGGREGSAEARRRINPGQNVLIERLEASLS